MICFIIILLILFTVPATAQIEVTLPDVIVTNIDLPVKIHCDSIYDGFNISIDGKQVNYNTINKDIAKKSVDIEVRHYFNKNGETVFRIGNSVIKKNITPIPLWMSILPPLIAILLAFIIKEVYISLFLGILSGTTIMSFYAGKNIFAAFFTGILRSLDTYIINSLNDIDHISIIVFSMIIGGIVQIITANGGMKGLVDILSSKAKSARSGQLITWLLGILIFFDDYANSLVIGNTMRPITDRLNISREKLSYIVDATAAPVASIAFITTWIGAQLTYIKDGLIVTGINMSPYQVYFHSLQFAFYPILTIIFIFILIMSGRDYGPMYKTEIKARKGKAILHVETTRQTSDPENDREIKTMLNNTEEDLNNKNSQKKRNKWYNAVIPILVLIIGALLGLFYTGKSTVGWHSDMTFSYNISNIIGSSNSFLALLWSSIISLIISLIFSYCNKTLILKESMEKMIDGFKTMLPAIIILIMAWAIANVTKSMYTAEFLSGLLIKMNLNYIFIPVLSFIFAFIIAFSTGTSWGTMAILYPLILPASWLITTSAGIVQSQSFMIFYNVTASVLSGAVFGDHCSPISDTTILSSLASSCNHIDHVRTQMPYALTVGGVSAVIGILLAALGVAWWITFPLCVIILFCIIRLFGKTTDKIVPE